MIDFDNIGEEESSAANKYINTLSFPIEEDIASVGAWILLYHPNFFGDSLRGKLRYLFWLVNALFIFAF